MRKPKILLAFIVLILSFLACSEIEIFNQGDRSVTVLIELPDGGGIRRISAHGSVALTSLDGGPYTITVMRDEEYLAQLREMEVLTLSYLGTAGVDSGEMLPDGLQAVSTGGVFATLVTLREQIEKEESNQGSCSGQLPETVYWGESSVPSQQEVDIFLEFNGSNWICRER